MRLIPRLNSYSCASPKSRTGDSTFSNGATPGTLRFWREIATASPRRRITYHRPPGLSNPHRCWCQASLEMSPSLDGAVRGRPTGGTPSTPGNGSVRERSHSRMYKLQGATSVAHRRVSGSLQPWRPLQRAGATSVARRPDQRICRRVPARLSSWQPGEAAPKCVRHVVPTAR